MYVCTCVSGRPINALRGPESRIHDDGQLRFDARQADCGKAWRTRRCLHGVWLVDLVGVGAWLAWMMELEQLLKPGLKLSYPNNPCLSYEAPATFRVHCSPQTTTRPMVCMHLHGPNTCLHVYAVSTTVSTLLESRGSDERNLPQQFFRRVVQLAR
ncbi:hypothetical protein F4801DRAFT_29388 [Xylaria longipes]|nr:hypothetical protein F4801DRAFT_29388 [Xylaria longipes]